MSCGSGEEMQASAVVLSNAPGRIQLAVTRQSACHACAEKKGCTSQQESTRAQSIWLASAQTLPPGKEVQLVMPANALLRAALLMYGLPLTGFLLGLLLGATFSEPAAMLASIAGLAAGLVLVRLLAHRLVTPLRLLDEKPVSPSIFRSASL